MRPVSIPLLILTLFSLPATAQVALDGSMGPAGSLAGPEFSIPHSLGTVRGSNLFHSFTAFNINVGERATFTGPGAIGNVIARVTGGTASTVSGTLRSEIPSANVFLINPSGVIFNAGASLEVQGSFYASTAGDLRLVDGGVFSAARPETSSITSAPPAAFGFLDASPGSIEVTDTGLEVPQGKSVALVGGGITLDGGIRGTPGGPATLRASGGRIELVGVAASGEVLLSSGDAGRDAAIESGRISIAASVISTSGDTGGAISIRGGQVVIDSTSVLSDTVSADGGDISFEGDQVFFRAGDVSDSRVRTRTSGQGAGGDIRVTAGSLEIADGIQLRTESRGTGAGGSIFLDATSVEVVRGSDVQTLAFDSGRGGDIKIAAQSLSIASEEGGSTNIRATVLGPFANGDYASQSPGASGDGGDISIAARNVRLPGGRIQTATYGIGRGGTINIEAERVTASNAEKVRNTGIRARVGDGDIPFGLRDVIRGDAGNITVKAADVEIRNGAVVDTTTFGAGRAGNLTVHADRVFLSGEGASLSGVGVNTGLVVETAGSGAGGRLEIRADTLDVRDRASVSANSRSMGRGGDVVIEARHVRVAGGQGVTVDSFGGGQGGTLSMRVDSLDVVGPASVSVTATGASVGGRIEIAAGEVLVSGSGANINAVALESGIGGTVSIEAGTVTVKGPTAAISARNFGAGSGGSVKLAADNVNVVAGGAIQVSTFGSGAGGDVSVTTDRLTLAGEGSEEFTGVSAVAEPGATGRAGDIALTIGDTFESIAASVAASASQSDGGNIRITATERIHLVDSSIETAVSGGEGRGGNISVDPVFVVLNRSRISANAFGGSGGNIDIVADYFIADSLSMVEASSAAGIDGTVNIDSPDVEITGGITLLPGALFNAALLLRAPCAARARTGSSSLSVTGLRSMPLNFDSYVPSPGGSPGRPSDGLRESKLRSSVGDSSALTSDEKHFWALMDSDCSG